MSSVLICFMAGASSVGDYIIEVLHMIAKFVG